MQPDDDGMKTEQGPTITISTDDASSSRYMREHARKR